MIVLDKVAAVARELQDRSLPALASPDGPSGLDCAGKLLQPQQVLLRASWLCQPWLPAPWQGAASAHFQIPWTAPQLLPSPSSCPPPPSRPADSRILCTPAHPDHLIPSPVLPLAFFCGVVGGGCSPFLVFLTVFFSWDPFFGLWQLSSSGCWDVQPTAQRQQPWKPAWTPTVDKYGITPRFRLARLFSCTPGLCQLLGGRLEMD